MITTPERTLWRKRIGKKWHRYSADVLPAWVADMDFDLMPGIRATLEEALDVADLGYPPVSDQSGVPESFAAWAHRRWRWKVNPAHIHLAPDVVGGMDNCIEALTPPHAGVVVQTPIYPPFMSSVRAAGRTLIEQPLNNGVIDFDALAYTLTEHGPAMLMLCNPHNPTGRAFRRAELENLADLALRHELIVVSDEIHADIVFDGRVHIPFASLAPEVAARTVTLTAASKAFNIAGLRTAVCVVSDEAMRARLLGLPPHRWAAYSTLGVRATLAAWTDQGENWLGACVQHLQSMRDMLARRLPEALPGVRYTPQEATYLAWLDCTQLGLGADPQRFFLERARVGLSSGLDFGAPGAGFLRINFATSVDILTQIVDRMQHAYRSAHP